MYVAVLELLTFIQMAEKFLVMEPENSSPTSYNVIFFQKEESLSRTLHLNLIAKKHGKMKSNH